MFIRVGIVVLICNTTNESCFYKNFNLTDNIDLQSIEITNQPVTFTQNTITTRGPTEYPTTTISQNFPKGTTEPLISDKNSNNIPLILTTSTIGSFLGIAGLITLIKRRRLQNTQPISQVVMPRVQRAYQNT